MDIPGHERLRPAALGRHAVQAMGVVFVVDSVRGGKEVLWKTAQTLFDILTDPRLKDVPILVACNKQVS